MASPLCGTGLYANDVLCEVINKLDGLNDLALQLKDEALLAIESLKQATEDGIGDITAINYSADTSGVSFTYTPPTEPTEPDYSGLGPSTPVFPDAPTITPIDPVDAAPAVPSAYDVGAASASLIATTVVDDIFDRASERLTRVSVKEERDAVYDAAAMGLGLPSSTLAVRLLAAQQSANDKISEAALEQAVQEGVWRREDTKTLHGLNVQNWPLHPDLELRTYQAEEGLQIEAYKSGLGAETDAYVAVVNGLSKAYQTQVDWLTGYLNAETARYSARLDGMRANIASEAEKRGWTEMQLRDILEQADKATGYAIEKARIIIENTYRAEEAVAQLMVGMTQGVFSAADYGLSGQGTQSVSESIAS
jgi:hypothetical protein